MTIAGGMVCADGVLLYADTEWTTSTLKIQRPKQWSMVSTDGRLKLAAAIAGDEDYARLTLNSMAQVLMEMMGKDPIRVSHIIDALSGALLNTYGFLGKDPNGASRHIQFLLAASTPDDPPTLLKTAGAAVYSSDDCEHIGCGYDFGAWLASKMFVQGMPLATAELLAAYILWEVKNHVPACGGDSIIYKLTNDGKMQYRAYGDIQDYQRHFDGIERSFRRLRVHTASLETSDEQFEELLHSFENEMRLRRKARQAAAEHENKIGE